MQLYALCTCILFCTFRIPSTHNDSSVIWIVFDCINYFLQLVNSLAWIIWKELPNETWVKLKLFYIPLIWKPNLTLQTSDTQYSFLHASLEWKSLISCTLSSISKLTLCATSLENTSDVNNLHQGCKSYLAPGPNAGYWASPHARSSPLIFLTHIYWICM